VWIPNKTDAQVVQPNKPSDVPVRHRGRLLNPEEKNINPRVVFELQPKSYTPVSVTPRFGDLSSVMYNKPLAILPVRAERWHT